MKLKRRLKQSALARPPRRRYQYPERALQSAVYQTLSYLKPECVWFPVPNGAADLGRKLGAILKAQGKIKPGVSDFIFMWGFGATGYADTKPAPIVLASCGAIELKSKDGELNDDQVKFKAECERLGIPFREARSIDEVVAILVEWGRLPANAIERIRGVSFERGK